MYHLCLPWANYRRRDGRRGAGRAKYDPLWWCGGGGRQEADRQGKNRKHGGLRFLLPCGPRLRPWTVPPPLSRRGTGLRPEPDRLAFTAMANERNLVFALRWLFRMGIMPSGQVEGANPSYSLPEGEARRRGGGTIIARRHTTTGVRGA